MVQVDHDGELGLMHGVCGTMDGEREVQRSIKRAELTSPPRYMLTVKELLLGCGEEMKCIGPNAGSAVL